MAKEWPTHYSPPKKYTKKSYKRGDNLEYLNILVKTQKTSGLAVQFVWSQWKQHENEQGYLGTGTGISIPVSVPTFVISEYNGHLRSVKCKK